MEQLNDIQKERQSQAAKIIERLKAGAPPVLAKYPVEIAYLYGSVARGCPLPTSDIDIALVLTEVPPAYERLKLELEIQAALEDACQLSNIDTRTINQAPLVAQGEFDYRPTAERMQRAFLDHIRREGLSHGQTKDR